MTAASGSTRRSASRPASPAKGSRVASRDGATPSLRRAGTGQAGRVGGGSAGAGRGADAIVLASDRPLIADMAAAGGRATFSDLATRIVTSRQFRNRLGDDVVASGQTSRPAPGVTILTRPSPSTAGTR